MAYTIAGRWEAQMCVGVLSAFERQVMRRSQEYLKAGKQASEAIKVTNRKGGELLLAVTIPRMRRTWSVYIKGERETIMEK